MSRLGLEAVTKRYGDVIALEDVSLSLSASGFHCLLGPNGSGKTTALRLLLGLERPTTGTVARADDLRVGSGFQRPSFYPSLSVRENLAVFGALLDADDDWRERLVAELRLGRALHRRAGDLSGGFARKLDLALAFLDRPDAVLLDEPLGALDAASRERVLSFLETYCEGGRTVVVSTHRVTAIESLFDRLTVLYGGHVIYDRRRDGIALAPGESLQDRYVELIRERSGPEPPQQRVED